MVIYFAILIRKSTWRRAAQCQQTTIAKHFPCRNHKVHHEKQVVWFVPQCWLKSAQTFYINNIHLKPIYAKTQKIDASYGNLYKCIDFASSPPSRLCYIQQQFDCTHARPDEAISAGLPGPGSRINAYLIAMSGRIYHSSSDTRNAKRARQHVAVISLKLGAKKFWRVRSRSSTHGNGNAYCCAR